MPQWVHPYMHSGPTPVSLRGATNGRTTARQSIVCNVDVPPSPLALREPVDRHGLRPRDDSYLKPGRGLRLHGLARLRLLANAYVIARRVLLKPDAAIHPITSSEPHACRDSILPATRSAPCSYRHIRGLLADRSETEAEAQGGVTVGGGDPGPSRATGVVRRVAP